MMKLSDFEIDVMNLVWNQPQCAAPMIHEAISEQRDVTYSTVKTIIDRLEEKGALERCGRSGRTIFYRARISPDSIRRPMLDEFLGRVFGGDSRPLMNHLLDGDHLNEDDLDYLEKLLSEKRRDGSE